MNLKIPKLKEGLEQVFVSKIHINAGDIVKKGDPLVLLQGFGETLDIQSPAAGKIRDVAVYPGKLVSSSETLAVLEEPKSDDAEKNITNNNKQEKIMTDKGSSDNVTPILMPQAGQSMEEGTILSWQIKEGDQIEVGQVICEIETDKATMEVEAVDAGRVARIVAGEGDIIEVKEPIAYLADNDQDVDAYLASQGGQGQADEKTEQSEVIEEPKQQAVSTQKSAATVEGGRVKASPAARKLADERGVDLNAIAAGSGPGGRITTADVPEKGIVSDTAVERPISKMRQAIARNLAWSKQNVPHFYTKVTVDAADMFSKYREMKAQFKCSVNDFVTRACAIGISEFPALRQQYNKDTITEQPNANIGIAVGTDIGLTVPVILKAEQMNFEQLASRTAEVVGNARNGKLEGVGQGVFTITNLGMYGVEEFSAIINPPESAILAVGAIREDVKVKDGAIKATQVMTMVLSADHRVIDGVVAAQFMQRIKELLENPEQLV